MYFCVGNFMREYLEKRKIVRKFAAVILFPLVGAE